MQSSPAGFRQTDSNAMATGLRERGGCRARATGPMGDLPRRRHEGAWALADYRRSSNAEAACCELRVAGLVVSKAGCSPSLRPTGTPAATAAAIVGPAVSQLCCRERCTRCFQQLRSCCLRSCWSTELLQRCRRTRGRLHVRVYASMCMCPPLEGRRAWPRAPPRGSPGRLEPLAALPRNSGN